MAHTVPVRHDSEDATSGPLLQHVFGRADAHEIIGAPVEAGCRIER
jgi:hypothetical protein